MNSETYSFPCKCGGICENVDPTPKEIEQYNTCGRPYNCCAAAFVCNKCGWRYACTLDAPEVDW